MAYINKWSEPWSTATRSAINLLELNRLQDDAVFARTLGMELLSFPATHFPYPQASISPNGRYLAYVDAQALDSCNPKVDTIFLADTRSKKVTLLVGENGVGLYQIADLRWLPDSRHILYTKLRYDPSQGWGERKGLFLLHFNHPSRWKRRVCITNIESGNTIEVADGENAFFIPN